MQNDIHMRGYKKYYRVIKFLNDLSKFILAMNTCYKFSIYIDIYGSIICSIAFIINYVIKHNETFMIMNFILNIA